MSTPPRLARPMAEWQRIAATIRLLRERIAAATALAAMAIVAGAQAALLLRAFGVRLF